MDLVLSMKYSPSLTCLDQGFDGAVLVVVVHLEDLIILELSLGQEKRISSGASRPDWSRDSGLGIDTELGSIFVIPKLPILLSHHL